jgi:hypothetical protein
MATSADGTSIAWYRYGSGERAVLFVPTWNIVDARVVGHQVADLEPHATVITYDPRGHGASGRPERGYDFPLHASGPRGRRNRAGSARLLAEVDAPTLVIHGPRMPSFPPRTPSASSLHCRTRGCSSSPAAATGPTSARRISSTRSCASS